MVQFSAGRAYPLLTLLKGKSGDIRPEDFEPISDLVANLNQGIEGLEDVQSIRTDIRTTIIDAVGETYSPKSLSIKSDLPNQAEKLFQSLKLFVGESDEDYEGAIHELSLGGANLIFLTLKLLEFKYQRARETFANFLLIEEPEAHIHTHIQKTLFDRINYEDTQIIYTTHSTHISEVSNVENINIIGRDAQGRACEIYQPSNGLSPAEVGNIQRYLDAVRSNLLFAKSVVLVEGDAEEILIPILVRKVLGVTLDELGISVVNIRSTGFKNVGVLFNQDRIRKNCAILTDLDKAFFDTTANPTDSSEQASEKLKAVSSQKSGSERKVVLDNFSSGNKWITTHFADHTFEVDFISAGNSAIAVSTLDKVYSSPQAIEIARSELESGDISIYGRRILKMAKYCGKGWFAIILGKEINEHTIIPDYILDAIFEAHKPVGTSTFSAILLHRVSLIEKRGGASATSIQDMRDEISGYQAGDKSFEDLRDKMLLRFPEDKITKVLARF